MSKERRQFDVRYDPSIITALQYGTWIDDERLTKTCIKEKAKLEDEASINLSTAHGYQTSCQC